MTYLESSFSNCGYPSQASARTRFPVVQWTTATRLIYLLNNQSDNSPRKEALLKSLIFKTRPNPSIRSFLQYPSPGNICDLGSRCLLRDEVNVLISSLKLISALIICTDQVYATAVNMW